ncbi:hypothetical protein Pogu_1129 [Pyrobaculum oguniense TE7]|uniref:Uncharacterized protein n=1 Tax=Pyrobaculum oguniense (strain DSM 13380 / JCM 10595 / TE7) TaxID=698757 RepID=H6QA34_PYROT|nr:hypothetical protein Pogu_1129 [Pyrobaculum oguniense TE7]
MQVRSYFYNTVYVPFRDGRYEDGLNGASNYRTYQTSAGFRRVYDYIIRVLDGISGAKGELANNQELRNRYRIALARLDITVQYQAARKVLDQDLANGIRSALREISIALQREDINTAARNAEALRLALDAVLAYKIVAGRGEEEEEFL